MQPAIPVDRPQFLQTPLCSRPIPFNDFVYATFNKIFEIAVILNSPLSDDPQNPYRISKKCSDDNEFTLLFRNIIHQLELAFMSYDLGHIFFIPNPAYLASVWRTQTTTHAIFDTKRGKVISDFPVEENKCYQALSQILLNRLEKVLDFALLDPDSTYIVGERFIELVKIDQDSKGVTVCASHLPHPITLSNLDNFEPKSEHLRSRFQHVLFPLNAPQDPYIGLNLASIKNVIFDSDLSLKIEFLASGLISIDLRSLSPVDAFRKINEALKAFKKGDSEPITPHEPTTSTTPSFDTPPDSIYCSVVKINFLVNEIIYIFFNKDQKSIHICKNITQPCTGNRLNLSFPTQAEFDEEAQNLTKQIKKLKSKLARFSSEKMDVAMNSFFLQSFWQTEKQVKFHFLGKDHLKATFADTLEFSVQDPHCFPFFSSRMEEHSQHQFLFFQDKTSRCQLGIDSIDLLITYKQKYSWDIVSSSTPTSPYQPSAAKETFKKKTRQLNEMLKDKLYLLVDAATTSVSLRLEKATLSRLDLANKTIKIEFASSIGYLLTQEHFGEKSITDSFDRLDTKMAEIKAQRKSK